MGHILIAHDQLEAVVAKYADVLLAALPSVDAACDRARGSHGELPFPSETVSALKSEPWIEADIDCRDGEFHFGTLHGRYPVERDGGHWQGLAQPGNPPILADRPSSWDEGPDAIDLQARTPHGFELTVAIHSDLVSAPEYSPARAELVRRVAGLRLANEKRVGALLDAVTTNCDSAASKLPSALLEPFKKDASVLLVTVECTDKRGYGLNHPVVQSPDAKEAQWTATLPTTEGCHGSDGTLFVYKARSEHVAGASSLEATRRTPSGSVGVDLELVAK